MALEFFVNLHVVMLLRRAAFFVCVQSRKLRSFPVVSVYCALGFLLIRRALTIFAEKKFCVLRSSVGTLAGSARGPEHQLQAWCHLVKVAPYGTLPLRSDAAWTPYNFSVRDA